MRLFGHMVPLNKAPVQTGRPTEKGKIALIERSYDVEMRNMGSACCICTDHCVRFLKSHGFVEDHIGDITLIPYV